MMARTRLLEPVLGLLLLVAACSTPPPPPEVETLEIDGLAARVVQSLERSIRVGCPVEGVGVVDLEATLVSGATSLGAEYLFFMPGPPAEPTEHWNGSLVLFARGYLPTAAPVGFPDPLPADLIDLRDALLCQGFAVGASSYSANGLAVREGIRDTHLLNPLFALHFRARPKWTYVMGQSMGGLITIALMELFPLTYDGAFAMCGPTAGSLAQMQYLGHVRVLVDEYFPSLFREDAMTPTRKTMQQVAAAVDRLAPPHLMRLATIQLPGSELFGGVPLLPIDPGAKTPAEQLQSLRTSLKGALYYYVVGMQDVLDRGGGQPFDNSSTFYTSASLPARDVDRLNRKVDRFHADSRALVYWRIWYQPKGWVWRPTINLHTLFDPDVPFAHAVAYEALADAARRSDNLLTVPVERYGHCAFTPEEVMFGFGALVKWVNSGEKPNLIEFPLP